MRFLVVPGGARCVRAWTVACAAFLVLPSARACVVGDPAGVPQVVLTETPPDCCYGQWAGSLHGTVSNVETDDVIVAVYAQTDIYYVQPFVGVTVEVGCGGTFSSPTHGGARYAAVLARRSWQAPAQMSALPAVGGDVLAVVRAPDAQRQITFAGSTWIVKATGDVPYGPGNNFWSDAADAVWVDGQGRLHLRITQRDGVWYSAEVFSQDYMGHGRYRFDVEGNLDALDPNVVFAGFFYSDQGDEADVEFSRWGDPNRTSNAQFVVQPNAIHPWFVPAVSRHTLQLDWSNERIDFHAWCNPGGALTQPTATWSHTGAVPVPDVERMRFNLWLFGGPPTDGNEVELIVSSFAYDTPTDVARAAPARLRVTTEPVSRDRVAYFVDLPQPASTELRVFDARGRLVEHLGRALRPAGRSRGVWDARRAPHGVYFLQVRSGAHRQATRFVLLP